MNKLYALLLFWAFAPAAFGQSEEIEKYRKVIASRAHDTLKLQAYSELNWLTQDSDPDLSEKYARDELKLAKKTRSKKWEAQALNDIGIAKYRKSELDSALKYYNLSLEIRRSLKDKDLMVSSLSKIGVVHQEMGNYNQALKAQFEVLGITESTGNTKHMAVTLNNIGIIYGKVRNYPQEIKYINRAVKIHRQNGDEYFVGQCYGNMAEAYQKMNDIRQSNEYQYKALGIFKKFGDKASESGIYNSIGMNLRILGKDRESLAYYKKAFDLSQTVGDKLGVALYGHNISCVLTDLGQYKLAEQYELATLEATEKNNHARQMLLYRQLATIYGYLHNGKKVDEYVDKYTELKDSIFNQNFANQMGEMEARFESEKTRRQLAEEKARVAQKEKINSNNELKLEARKKWLVVTITFSALLLGAAIWIYRSQRIKRQNEKREFELNRQLQAVMLEKGFAEEKIRIARELHDNIGSHLTFMISSLDNLSYDKSAGSRLEKIGDLSNFGRLTMKDLRDTIWAMNHDGGTLEQLITRISELRSVLPGDLSVEIDNQVHPEQELNGLQMLNCFRIVQEFMQNSIKYAEASLIRISIGDQDDGLSLRIHDNGKGFEVSRVSFGNGLLNMQRRCEDLGGTFTITSGSRGTSISCEIPYKMRVAELQAQ